MTTHCIIFRGSQEARQLIMLHENSAFVCIHTKCYRNAIITDIFPVGMAVYAHAVHRAKEKENMHYDGESTTERQW